MALASALAVSLSLVMLAASSNDANTSKSVRGGAVEYDDADAAGSDMRTRMNNSLTIVRRSMDVVAEALHALLIAGAGSVQQSPVLSDVRALFALSTKARMTDNVFLVCGLAQEFSSLAQAVAKKITRPSDALMYGGAIGAIFAAAGKAAAALAKAGAKAAVAGAKAGAKVAVKAGKAGAKVAVKAGKAGAKLAVKAGKAGAKLAVKAGRAGGRLAAKAAKATVKAAIKAAKKGASAAMKAAKKSAKQAKSNSPQETQPQQNQRRPDKPPVPPDNNAKGKPDKAQPNAQAQPELQTHATPQSPAASVTTRSPSVPVEQATDNAFMNPSSVAPSHDSGATASVSDIDVANTGSADTNLNIKVDKTDDTKTNHFPWQGANSEQDGEDEHGTIEELLGALNAMTETCIAHLKSPTDQENGRQCGLEAARLHELARKVIVSAS